MGSRRNYISSVFCLLLAGWFLFNTGLYSFIYSIQIQHHRHSQWERMEEKMKTETLVFSTPKDFSKIVWIDKKEFYFEGRLYDFRSLSISSHRWIIKCVNDEKEKQMKIAFSQSWNKEQRSATTRKFSSAFQFLTFFENTRFSQLATVGEIHKLWNFRLPESPLEAAEPPPPKG